MENQEEFDWAKQLLYIRECKPKKRCSKCRILKSLDDFYPRYKKNPSLGRASSCAECCRKKKHSDYRKDIQKSRANSIEDSKIRRDRNNLFILEHKKKNPCCECGETDPLVLDFDHKDPSTKRFNISDAVPRKYGLPIIQTEINKCVVLCANCHRRKTAKQFEFFSYKVLHEGYIPYHLRAEVVE